MWKACENAVATKIGDDNAYARWYDESSDRGHNGTGVSRHRARHGCIWETRRRVRDDTMALATVHAMAQACARSDSTMRMKRTRRDYALTQGPARRWLRQLFVKLCRQVGAKAQAHGSNVSGVRLWHGSSSFYSVQSAFAGAMLDAVVDASGTHV